MTASEHGSSPALRAQAQCQHVSKTTGYDHHDCNDCGAFRTDSQPEWGIARNMWFRDRHEAEFYKKNGRVPERPASEMPKGWVLVPAESDGDASRALFEAASLEYWPNSNPPDGAWQGWQMAMRAMMVLVSR